MFLSSENKLHRFFSFQSRTFPADNRVARRSPLFTTQPSDWQSLFPFLSPGPPTEKTSLSNFFRRVVFAAFFLIARWSDQFRFRFFSRAGLFLPLMMSSFLCPVIGQHRIPSLGSGGLPPSPHTAILFFPTFFSLIQHVSFPIFGICRALFLPIDFPRTRGGLLLADAAPIAVLGLFSASLSERLTSRFFPRRSF